MAKIHFIRGIRRPLLLIISVIVAYCTISKIYRTLNEPENIYVALSREQNINCDVPEDYISLPKTFKAVELAALTTTDRNIFFVESWQSCNSLAHLTPRSACAVESAARLNPKWTVYLFFIDTVGYDNSTAPIIEQLQSFPNVRMVGMSLDDLARNTTMYEWILQGYYKKSKYRIAHVADIVRLLVLHHYAGTYLDLDMISMKSLDHLGTNYALAQYEDGIMNSIINFGSDNIGRSVAAEAVRLVPKEWNPNDWIAIGPGLLYKLFTNLCQTKKTSDMTPDKCLSFKTIPPGEALAVLQNTLEKRKYLFDEQYLEEALRLSQNSTFIHFSNSVTNKMDAAPKNMNNLQNYLGRHQCPSTFSVIDKWL